MTIPTTHHDVVRVGVAQPVQLQEILPSDTDEPKMIEAVQVNAAHAIKLVDQAANEGVQMLCFPEDLGSIAYYASQPSNLPQARRIILQTAATVVEMFQAAAAKAKIHIIGSAYVPEGETIYNLGFFIDSSGEIIGRYRKTHTTRGEQPLAQPGTTYPVFDTPFGGIGILICADLNLPEPACILALNGAQLIFCPTMGFDYGGEDMGEMRMRVRAFDSAVYLACSSYASKHADRPGRSCIVGPQGNVIADAGYTPDTIVWADICPTKRPPDPMDPEGKTGWTKWTVLSRHRRPQTYEALIRPVDREQD